MSPHQHTIVVLGHHAQLDLALIRHSVSVADREILVALGAR